MTTHQPMKASLPDSSGGSVTTQSTQTTTVSKDPTLENPEDYQSSSLPTPILALGAWLDTFLDTGNCCIAWNCSMDQWKQPTNQRKANPHQPHAFGKTLADDVDDDAEDTTTIATFSTATTSSSSSPSLPDQDLEHDETILNDPQATLSPAKSEDDSSLHLMVQGILKTNHSHGRVDPDQQELTGSLETQCEPSQLAVAVTATHATEESNACGTVETLTSSPTVDRRALYQDWKRQEPHADISESAWEISQRTTNTESIIQEQDEDTKDFQDQVRAQTQENAMDWKVGKDTCGNLESKEDVFAAPVEDWLLQCPQNESSLPRTQETVSDVSKEHQATVTIGEDLFALEPSVAEGSATPSSVSTSHFPQNEIEEEAVANQFLRRPQVDDEALETNTRRTDLSSQKDSPSVTQFEVPSPSMDCLSIVTADESLEQVYAPILPNRTPSMIYSSPSSESWGNSCCEQKRSSLRNLDAVYSSSSPTSPALYCAATEGQEQALPKPSSRSKKNIWTRPWKFLRKRFGRRKKKKQSGLQEEPRAMKNTFPKTGRSVPVCAECRLEPQS